jgi:hypothetical protein
VLKIVNWWDFLFIVGDVKHIDYVKTLMKCVSQSAIPNV